MSINGHNNAKSFFTPLDSSPIRFVSKLSYTTLASILSIGAFNNFSLNSGAKKGGISFGSGVDWSILIAISLTPIPNSCINVITAFFKVAFESIACNE